MVPLATAKPSVLNWAKDTLDSATKSDLPQLTTDDAKIEEVSKQFEAIILRNFLKEGLKPMFKSYLAEDNSQNSIHRSYIVDALSQSMAERQALGISNVLQMQLKSQYATTNKATSK
jgi:Rod binding domain-containing protein